MPNIGDGLIFNAIRFIEILCHEFFWRQKLSEHVIQLGHFFVGFQKIADFSFLRWYLIFCRFTVLLCSKIQK